MYTAIIVEPRKHPALLFVLNNVLTNLSDDWKIVICCGNKNQDFVMSIIHEKLSRFIDRISCFNLGVDNLTKDQYSLLLTNPKFYDMIPTEIFLIFQTDSMIFSKNKDRINDFLEYDYVGAPWNHFPVASENVGNGGFSLRRKSKMLEIISTKPYYKTTPEDVYFCYHRTIQLHKPDFEKAKQFSVEAVFYEQPFACHLVWDTLSESNIKKLCELHPELNQLIQLNTMKY